MTSYVDSYIYVPMTVTVTSSSSINLQVCNQNVGYVIGVDYAGANKDILRRRIQDYFHWLSEAEVDEIINPLTPQKIELIYMDENSCDFDFVPHKHRIRLEMETLKELQAEVKKQKKKIAELRHEELVIKLSGIGE